MTLNVTLSLSAEALAQAGETKYCGVKSKCIALRIFKAFPEFGLAIQQLHTPLPQSFSVALYQ